MMTKTHGLLLLVLFSLVSVSWANGTNVKDPYKHFFNETWGDLPEELIKAKESEKKGIFIFFEDVDCPFCNYMKQNVLNQPNVQKYYRKHFLSFIIDIKGDLDMVDMKGKNTNQKDFAKKNRIRATPVIAYYNLDGKMIYRHTGKTSGVEEFMWLGEYIVNEIYKKKIRFSRYKRQKRAVKNKN